VTDVNRVRRKDTGNPDICNIYTMHRAFSGDDVIDEAAKGCRSASIGCIDCKKMLFKNMWEELAPIQKKAVDLLGNQDYVMDVLRKEPKSAAPLQNRPYRRCGRPSAC